MNTNATNFLQSCIIIDTETDSQDFKLANIIETGWTTWNSQAGIWENNNRLHEPPEPIPPKISSITYITDDMVRSKAPFSDFKNEFQEIINTYLDGYVVAHNGFYDQKVLTRAGVDTSDHKWICTMRMARKLYVLTGRLTEYGLPFLRFALKLNIPIETICHRAGNDTFITGELLRVMVEELVSTGEIDGSQPIGDAIYEWCWSPIEYKTMPYGKHKGLPLTQVPGHYWSWALDNTDWFNPDADNYDKDFADSVLKAIG